MKLSILILFILILQLTVLSQNRKGSKPSVARPTSKQRVPLSLKEREFNLSVTSLPPNYQGNSFQSLLGEISNRNLSSENKKSEFETTAQFNERLSKIENAPYKSGLNKNSFFGFVLSNANTPITYNADAKEFGIEVKLYTLPNCAIYPEIWWKCKSLILHYKFTELESYIAENAFGAKILVKKEHFLYLLLELTGEQNLVPNGQDSYYFTLKANPEVARNIKSELGVVAIGHIAENILGADVVEVSPTRDKPVDSKSNYLNLKFNLASLWLFNKRTGKIYSKLQAE